MDGREGGREGKRKREPGSQGREGGREGREGCTSRVERASRMSWAFSEGWTLMAGRSFCKREGGRKGGREGRRGQ